MDRASMRLRWMDRVYKMLEMSPFPSRKKGTIEEKYLSFNNVFWRRDFDR